MEYEEISDIIDEMKENGWTINDYDIHFLIGFSKYVMKKSNVVEQCNTHSNYEDPNCKKNTLKVIFGEPLRCSICEKKNQK